MTVTSVTIKVAKFLPKLFVAGLKYHPLWKRKITFIKLQKRVGGEKRENEERHNLLIIIIQTLSHNEDYHSNDKIANVT